MTAPAFATPLRAVPTFQSWGRVRGPSALNNAIGNYRQARNACDYTWSLSKAYAALARANRTRPENRRMAQAAALREINAIRAARRAAWKARDAAEVALYRAGGRAADVDAADAARLVQHRADTALPAGCLAVEDDPDMAGATWLVSAAAGGRGFA